jgi:hypothetical protein
MEPMNMDDFIRSLLPEGTTHETFREPTEVYVTADQESALVTVGEGLRGTHIRLEVVNGQLKTTVERYSL